MASATSTKPGQDLDFPNGSNEEDQQLDAVIQATQQRQSIVEITAAKLGVGRTKLFSLLRNVWKTSEGQDPLSESEMFQGISMIARYDLDPISREVYVTRDKKGRLLTIIGIDGWVKILDRTPGFDGFEQDIEFGNDGESYKSVKTKIYNRTRKHPAVYCARMSEWKKMGGYTWNSIPNHMLQLLSLRHAARLFTPLGGSVVTSEEVEWIDRQEDTAQQEAEIATMAGELAKGGRSPDDSDVTPVGSEDTDGPESSPVSESKTTPENERTGGELAGDLLGRVQAVPSTVDGTNYNVMLGLSSEIAARKKDLGDAFERVNNVCAKRLAELKPRRG